jgi:hypothetical protein
VTEGWGRISFQTLTTPMFCMLKDRALAQPGCGHHVVADLSRSAICMVRYFDRLRENLGKSHSVATGRASLPG